MGLASNGFLVTLVNLSLMQLWIISVVRLLCRFAVCRYCELAPSLIPESRRRRDGPSNDRCGARLCGKSDLEKSRKNSCSNDALTLISTPLPTTNFVRFRVRARI